MSGRRPFPLRGFAVAGFALAGLAVGPSSSLAGCGAAERAAAKDPMKCEQNPDCAKNRGAYADCSRQCADNPECVDRCIEMAVDQPKH